MHQILKTRQLTYIPPVQGYCLTKKELGLNADHTDFCGNIQLIKEITNHKAQPQGNLPLSTGF